MKATAYAIALVWLLAGCTQHVDQTTSGAILSGTSSIKSPLGAIHFQEVRMQSGARCVAALSTTAGSNGFGLSCDWSAPKP